MRVLHCIHSLSGGGAERQLTLFLNNVASLEMDCGVFCVNSDNNLFDDGACELYTLEDIKNYPWRMVKEISSVIKKFKPDLIHLWLPPTIVVPGLIAAKQNGIKVIISYRCAKKFYTFKDVLEWGFGFFFANGVISNNPIEQANYFFRQLFKMKSGKQISNIVDIDNRYRLARDNRVDSGVFTFLFVGRLIDVKNWQVILDALSFLDTSKDWQLILCGAGDNKKVKKRVAELGLHSRVNLMGFCNDIYEYMAYSDVLILPSWREGMPNAPLEAMRIGLPCVLSRISAHTSIFSCNSGVEFFDPKDSRELAIILSSFLSGHKDLAEISYKGIEFSNAFAPELIINEYKSYYEKVLCAY